MLMEEMNNIRPKKASFVKNNPNTKSKRDISGYYHDLEEPFNPVRGEMALWRSVITQALMDAASNSRKSETQYHKREALKWLLTESDDFAAVCEHAGLDQHYVRRMAKAALSRGCRWRAESAPKSGATT